MTDIELGDYLEPSVKERALKLLKKPYAGSKAFKFNHSDVRYVSNCHGTMAYVFDLYDSIIKEKIHPDVISDNQMKKLIHRFFLPSDKLDLGNLVCFYEVLEDKSESLLHSALLIGENGQIFQQSGGGGIFELKTIEEKLRTFINSEPVNVEVRSYRLKTKINE